MERISVRVILERDSKLLQPLERFFVLWLISHDIEFIFQKSRPGDLGASLVGSLFEVACLKTTLFYFKFMRKASLG